MKNEVDNDVDVIEPVVRTNILSIECHKEHTLTSGEGRNGGRRGEEERLV